MQGTISVAYKFRRRSRGRRVDQGRIFRRRGSRAYRATMDGNIETGADKKEGHERTRGPKRGRAEGHLRTRLSQNPSLQRESTSIPDTGLGCILPVLVVPEPDLHEEDVIYTAPLFQHQHRQTSQHPAGRSVSTADEIFAATRKVRTNGQPPLCNARTQWCCTSGPRICSIPRMDAVGYYCSLKCRLWFQNPRPDMTLF